MIRIKVRGLPAPQGSKRAIVNRYTRKAALVESSKCVAPWRSDVRDAAEKAMGDQAPLTGPIDMTLAFRLPRPKGHYRTGKHANELREAAPRWPAGKPDIDKIARSTLDALSGLVFVDDAQVVRLILAKHYADEGPAGVDIWVLSA